MANIQKPDMTNIWASEGARVEPTEAKQLEGWVVEPPPHQWENWSQWRQDSALAHIFQKGVPLWDDKTSFHEGGSSYVQGSDGKIYISLQRSGGSVAARNPVTAGNKAFWKVAFTASDEMIAQSRITNLTSDLGNKASTSYVNTELGKKLTKSSNLSDLTNVTTARTNLGLGSSSVYPINDSVTLGSSVSVASSKAVKTLNDSKANKTTKVIAGTGLTGGGDLSTNRTFNVSYGVIANTAAQGNDSRIVGAVQDTQIKQAVGSSVTDLMSQKATTDAINLAAGTSTWAGVSGKPVSGVASQVETDAGVSDTTTVTPKKLRFGFGVSLASDGYIAFPSWMGGLIIQWCTSQIIPASSNGRVEFPIAFPNTALNCVATFTDEAAPIRSVPTNIIATTRTAVALRNPDASASQFRVIAIGH